MEVIFAHGCLCDSYEKQANEQGFTLGDKAEMLEELKHSYNMLRLHNCITNSQADIIIQKIQKQIIKHLKKLK